MEEKRYLTFALGKGRLAKKTLELFEKIGITCDEIRDPDTRKLNLDFGFSLPRDRMCLHM